VHEFPDMTEQECVAALRVDENLKRISPGMHARIAALHFLCDSCLEIRESATSESRRLMNIQNLWRKTYGPGLLPISAKQQQFENSDLEIEARNPLAWQWARNWKPVSDGNAWLYGYEGVGKTYLARAQAGRMLAKGHTVGEVSAIEWVQRAGDFKWDEHRRKLTGLYFLIFDDIDKPIWTTRGFENLYELVKIRSESGRRTWITSNAEPKVVAKKWGNVQGDGSMLGSLRKRLRPMKAWELTGESLRSGG
jgi:DNA replication protein DnaC